MPFPTGGAALVRYIRGYQLLAEHWRRILPPDRFIGIEYEHLVSEPEAVIRPLLAACGLDWGRSLPAAGPGGARDQNPQQMAGAAADKP